MKKPSKKKALLVGGIAGATLLVTGGILGIHAHIEEVEELLCEKCNLELDLNHDGALGQQEYLEYGIDGVYGPAASYGNFID